MKLQSGSGNSLLAHSALTPHTHTDLAISMCPAREPQAPDYSPTAFLLPVSSGLLGCARKDQASLDSISLSSKQGGGKAAGGLSHPSSTSVRGSYFFFSRRSFSAWVPNLAGTIGSCRLSSESVSRTGKEDMGMSAALRLLPWPRPRKQSSSSSRCLLHTEQPEHSCWAPISFPGLPLKCLHSGQPQSDTGWFIPWGS